MRRTIMIIRILVIAIAVLQTGVVATTVQHSWDCDVGDWFNQECWDPPENGLPKREYGDIARIDNCGIVEITYDEPNAYDLQVGVSAGQCGNITQQGGNAYYYNLHLGIDPCSTGTYNLSGGSIHVSHEIIGMYGSGIFHQEGGKNVPYQFTLGQHAGSVGEYTLSGTDEVQLRAMNWESIGENGTGIFKQTGGTNTVTYDLTLGMYESGRGEYIMSGGVLSTDRLQVGLEGAGEFRIDNSAVDIRVDEELFFGAYSEFEAVHDSTIDMNGASFDNWKDVNDSVDLAGLSNLELIFGSGQHAGGSTFEVSGLIDGGFIDNFALGKLMIGGAEPVGDGFVQLVDIRDNGNRGDSAECLFVGDPNGDANDPNYVVIEPGSSLDLNGLRVYEHGDQKAKLDGYIADGRVFDNTRMLRLLDAVYVEEQNWTVIVAIIYVDDDADGRGDGTSWEDAFNSLQDGLDAAISGDEIWVARGTYTPDSGGTVTEGDRSATFQLKNGVAVYGGFAASRLEHSPDDRTRNKNETILTGDLNGDDDVPNFGNNEENSFHVVTGSGTDETAVLDGFTISGGNANGTAPYDDGAGMYIMGGSPRIDYCLFHYNWAMQGGGGMVVYSADSEPKITDCNFSRNRADHGGGLLNDGNTTLLNCPFTANVAHGGSESGFGGGLYVSDLGRTILENCVFSENSSFHGGGIFTSGPEIIMHACAFLSNSTDSHGGGMYARKGGESERNYVTATSCLFYANRCSEGGTGGAMFNVNGTSAELLNCTFVENSVAGAGNTDGIYVGKDSHIDVNSCILWENDDVEIGFGDNGAATVNYSDVKGGWEGEDNIALDPLFIDQDDPDGEDNIFRIGDDGLSLSVGSPCIDTGDPWYVYEVDERDLAGQPRRKGRVDMGAYENENPQPVWYVDDNARNDPWPGDPSISDPDEDGTADHPFDSIQEAVDEALPYYTIMVRDGVYTGNGNRGISLRGKMVYLYSENGPDDCIIDCEGQGQGFKFESGEDSGTVVEGFTIINGRADDGGGVYCEDSSPTIRRCKIIGCEASEDGGGMYNTGSSPTVENCVFIANWVSGDGDGGAIRNTQGSNPSLVNCSFYENGPGDGISSNTHTDPNRASEATLVNCIVWGNEPGQVVGPNDTSYSDVQGGCPGEGNMDDDPLFVDPDGCDDVLGTADDNLRLSVDSPCVDAADPSTVPGPEDVEGSPREIGPGGIDMGAYEYHTEIGYFPSEFDFNGLKDFPHLSEFEPDYLDVWNNAGGQLQYTVEYECNWLDIDPSSGKLRNDDLCGDEPNLDSDEVRVDPAGLAAGNYVCTVEISALYATNSPQFVDVNLTIEDNCFSILIAADPNNSYSEQYASFVAYADDWYDNSELNCWCGVHGNPAWPYQCDGDAKNDAHLRGYIVFTTDLAVLSNSWKAKLGDANLDPCADFDHKSHRRGFRVYRGDLAILQTNWKKKAGPWPDGLPGDCPLTDAENENHRD